MQREDLSAWMPSLVDIDSLPSEYRIVTFHDFKGNKGRAEGTIWNGDPFLTAKRLFKIAVVRLPKTPDGVEEKLDILACYFRHPSIKSMEKLPAEFRCALEDGGGIYARFSRKAVSARRDSVGNSVSDSGTSPAALAKPLENALSSLSLSSPKSEPLPSQFGEEMVDVSSLHAALAAERARVVALEAQLAAERLRVQQLQMQISHNQEQQYRRRTYPPSPQSEDLWEQFLQPEAELPP